MSTQQLLNYLHRDGPYNFIQNLTAGADGKARVSQYYKQGETVKCPVGWNNDKANLYFGVHPVNVMRPHYEAGRELDVAGINCLYAEFDGVDFTGKEGKADKEAQYATDPAYYNNLAMQHILALTIQPNVIVFSGGGYHCYWLLNKPFIIAQDPDQHSAHITRYIKDIQERWVAFVGGDDNAKDLRRVLRIPGTYNHKAKYAPNYPKVETIKEDLAYPYSLADLIAPLPAPVCPPSYKPPCNQSYGPSGRTFDGENSVIEAYNKKHDIVELLLSYGYTKGRGSKMNYPQGDSEAVQIDGENRCFSHSRSDKLWNKERNKRRPFDVFRILSHDGDTKAAVKAAAAELGMEKKTAQPEPTFKARIAAIREWLVTADLSQIIPKHLQSAKGYRTAATDKRAFDACLDIFEQYGKFDGPISKMQGSRASGLSENTFHSALKRLAESPIFERITPKESIQDGAFWYSTTLAYFDRVGVVSKAIPPRSIYASVFSAQKAEDAWQLRGSKYQRENALIKACGPDALLMVATLEVGVQTHQAIVAERLHKTASAVSRLVKRLEDIGLISLQRIGRQQYITLLPDWQERLAEAVPYMTTAGNKSRREWGLDNRLVEDIDKKLARKVGNPVRLLAKREQAMGRLTSIMESDMAGMDTDLMAEKMRRLLRADSLRRNATAEKKTVASLDVATHRNNQAKAPWLSKNSPSAERRTNELMQELEENEMLLEAREELRRAA